IEHPVVEDVHAGGACPGDADPHRIVMDVAVTYDPPAPVDSDGPVVPRRVASADFEAVEDDAARRRAGRTPGPVTPKHAAREVDGGTGDVAPDAASTPSAGDDPPGTLFGVVTGRQDVAAKPTTKTKRDALGHKRI